MFLPNSVKEILLLHILHKKKSRHREVSDLRRVTQSVGSPAGIIVLFIRMKRGRVLDSTLGTWVEPAFGDPSPAALPLPPSSGLPSSGGSRVPASRGTLTRHP